MQAAEMTVQATADSSGKLLVEMKNVSKRFPGVLANDNIDFDLRRNEIHCLLGENGAGKTTLMSILSGFYKPDHGEILVEGKKMSFASPREAITAGIGMVHQHFMLVPTFNILENVSLGLKSSREPRLDLDVIDEKLSNLMQKYNFQLDSKAKIWQLSVGEQQKAEILTVLYKEAKVVILDEPTASLGPLETRELFDAFRTMVKEGRGVVFITHKLDEAMTLSNRITVLRNGRVVKAVAPSETGPDELARMMVGREVIFDLARSSLKAGSKVLTVEGLHALSDRGLPALRGISFNVNEGEILGFAGAAGNGQVELAECIVGVRKSTKGRVVVKSIDATNKDPHSILGMGVGYIPEDRIGKAVALTESVTNNALLGSHTSPSLLHRYRIPLVGGLFRAKTVRNHVDSLITMYDVKTAGADRPTRTLSGGNLQKLVLARELSKAPQLIILHNPTRGLDVGATEYVRRKLLEFRAKKMAVVLISEDLDEILTLSDRIAVVFQGRIMGIVSSGKVDLGEFGLMMAGAKQMSSDEGLNRQNSPTDPRLEVN
jgi:simple sugar transport system ATP-binding protein